MSEIDAPPLNWSDLGVSELVPTGTVTLLLADVEGSTRLWEAQPDEMTAAFGNLDRTLADVVAAHGGVRPVEQGEGDSFVIAFGRASDAAACALELQRAPLAPIRLRIGLHTGEVQLRDEANYIGPTINRTARLRDLAHGGQTVLSGTTSDLVCERLPADAWLAELGTHPVRDLPRPERVVQLCHPDIRNEFPPLRTAKTSRSHNLPAQLTSFIGRTGQIEEVRRLVLANRLVTLTGAGGAGKTRMAVEVSGALTNEFTDGVWYVDLAAVADPVVVPTTIARTMGLPDQPGKSALETVVRFISERTVLLLLDNCEHLLDSSGDAILTLLSGCPQLTVLTTSREPISVGGEVTWRVPSLSLDDEAIALFADRAQRARPTFHIADDDADLVADICKRLDGIPLAIELAAARVRALSLRQIADSLHDRFRLLTGGARNVMRRQQTLRASVDWSHALLTEPERVLFRRLGVFMGGFDLNAAQTVAATTEVEQFQILDQLSLLVDKSLVIAEDESGAMRYRLLETVRQYALEKLSESGEADTVRDRHRDHYVAAAAARQDEAGHGRVRDGVRRQPLPRRGRRACGLGARRRRHEHPRRLDRSTDGPGARAGGAGRRTRTRRPWTHGRVPGCLRCSRLLQPRCGAAVSGRGHRHSAGIGQLGEALRHPQLSGRHDEHRRPARRITARRRRGPRGGRRHRRRVHVPSLPDLDRIRQGDAGRSRGRIPVLTGGRRGGVGGR
jgi:predicted ATPase/class 3 adenylate cyclase